MDSMVHKWMNGGVLTDKRSKKKNTDTDFLLHYLLSSLYTYCFIFLMLNHLWLLQPVGVISHVWGCLCL